MNIQIEKLKPHQVEPSRHLLDCLTRGNVGLDLSGMGTGKTYVAAAVANALQIPTLVIPPHVAISSWHRAAEHFDDSLSVVNYEKLRTGRTPYGWWDNTPPPGWEREEFYTCQCCQRPIDFDNFDPCYCHPEGVHCMIIKKRKWEYGNFHFHANVHMVIFDEAHRCDSVNSLNAKMMIAAKREGKKIMALSATPALNPLHMQALGYACGLHTLTPADGLGFYQWARRYGCKKDPAYGGFVWQQSEKRQLEIMADIGRLLVPKLGVCVKADDIPGFPECDISAELYDLDENGKIDEIYSDMADALANLDKRSENDVDENSLTKCLRAHQRLELMKVPIAVELARDYQAKGYSVVIGVNFSATLAEIRKRLGWTCFVDGSREGVKFRQKHIDDYQENRQTGMVMNVKAGGVCISLQDLYGGHPRVGLLFPGFSATDTKQFFGRLRREGGKTKSHYRVILVAGSAAEKQIHRNLKVKLNNLDALTDQDLMPDNLRLQKISLPRSL